MYRTLKRKRAHCLLNSGRQVSQNRNTRVVRKLRRALPATNLSSPRCSSEELPRDTSGNDLDPQRAHSHELKTWSLTSYSPRPTEFETWALVGVKSPAIKGGAVHMCEWGNHRRRLALQRPCSNFRRLHAGGGVKISHLGRCSYRTSL